MKPILPALKIIKTVAIVGVFIALASFPLVARAAEPSSFSDAVGVSPGKLTHWGNQWVFRDAFKQSMPWRSNEKNRALHLDHDGWVASLEEGQFAWSLLHSQAGPHYPGGGYRVSYDGKGELRFSGAAEVVQASPGEMLVEVDPKKGGIRLELRATDPENPLRNLQILPEALAGGGPEASVFHPRFLELLDGFTVIRFSHLMKAGDDNPRSWEARVTPGNQTQAGGKGIALEYAIALSNELQADAWFTIPVAADAAYMRSFAEMVKQRLNPALRVYVEYGDDVGVWPTKSSQYCLEEGRELGLGEDWTQARNRYYARRSKELFAIWNEVFENDERLITVLNALSDEVCKMAADGADAAGMVTLFGSKFGKLENIDHLLSMDLDALMDELEKEAEINDGVNEEIARAKRFNLQPVSFYMTPIICALGPIAKERGKEIHEQVIAKALAMLEHPKMEPIFRKFIQSWRDAGGGLWIHEGLVHQPSQWGWFGLLKHMDEDPEGSPKFRAVRAEMIQGIPLRSDAEEKAVDPIMGSAAGWTVRLDIDGYFPDEGILVSTQSPDFWKQGPGAFITKPPYLNGKERQKYHRVYIRPTGEDWTEQMLTVVPDADGKLDLSCYVVAPGTMNIVHWDDLRAEGATLRNGSFEAADEEGLPAYWRKGGWKSEAPEGEYRTGTADAADGEDYVTASWTQQWITTLADVKKDQPIVLRWKNRFVPPETRYPVRVGISGLTTGGESGTSFQIPSGMRTDNAAPERYINRLLDGFGIEKYGKRKQVNTALGIYLTRADEEWQERTIRLEPKNDGKIELTFHGARIRDLEENVYTPVIIDYKGIRVEGANLPDLKTWARIGKDTEFKIYHDGFIRTWYHAGLRAKLDGVKAGTPVVITMKVRISKVLRSRSRAGIGSTYYIGNLIDEPFQRRQGNFTDPRLHEKAINMLDLGLPKSRSLLA